MHPQIEVDLAYTVTFLRRFEIPMYRNDIKTLMNRMLKAIPLERRPFKKAEVCTIMQPYFLLKQADLPTVRRTNAGVAAARLDDP